MPWFARHTARPTPVPIGYEATRKLNSLALQGYKNHSTPLREPYDRHTGQQ
jgi:hypothetical protein